jgi:hypothetical protein
MARAWLGRALFLGALAMATGSCGTVEPPAQDNGDGGVDSGTGGAGGSGGTSPEGGTAGSGGTSTDGGIPADGSTSGKCVLGQSKVGNCKL